MKVYTKTGDKGVTSLFSGERVKKNDIQVEAYGGIDEVCSLIGLICALLPKGEMGELEKQLNIIQQDLFTIGAILATSASSDDIHLLKKVDEKQISWIEEQIDGMQERVDELHSFILPGGHPAAAQAHVVRTVCRRVERRILTLQEQDIVTSLDETLKYVNRLSDYFFVAARYINWSRKIPEMTWQG